MPPVATFTWTLLSHIFLLILLVNCSNGGNITLALLWNEEGTASIAKELFESKFRPSILEACPSAPGINETSIDFVEIVQTTLMDIATVWEKLDSLGSCLFVGAHADVSMSLLFAQANVSTGLTSGSAAARRYPRMRLHQVAPIKFLLVSEGASRALSLSLGASLAVGSRLSIVLGSGYEAYHFERLVAQFRGSVQIYRLVPGSEVALVNALQLDKATNFLVAAKPIETEAFMLAAYNGQMLNPSYRWFMFNTLLVKRNDFDGFKVTSKNITSMDFGPISSIINNGINSTQAIYLFDILSLWSVYLKNILCNEPAEVNTRVNGLTGSFNLASDGTVSRENWFMYFYKGLGDQRERIGNWSSTGEFQFDPALHRAPTDEMLKKELNLNVFKVVTLLSAPYVQFKKGYENRTDVSLYDRLEGFAMDMCKQILANMSLKSVEVFLQPEGGFGAFDPVKGWSGMVATLMQGGAGLACAPMSDTDERRAVMKFTQPIKSYQLSILFAKPEVNPVVRLFEFLSPLHLHTWLALLGSVLSVALVLAVLHQLSRNEHSFSLYETVFISFASLIQGLTGVTPTRPSALVVTAAYWLFAFVILVAYVTNYAAERTLERVQAEITGLDSLSVQATYEYGTLFGSVYLGFLKGSNDPLQQAAFRYIENDPQRRQPRNTSQALDMVSSGKFAFIYNSVMNEYNAKMMCDFHVAGKFGQDSALLGLPESAEYDDMINRIINDLVNIGERDRLFQKYFNPPKSNLPDCTDKPLPYAISNWIPQEPDFFNTKHGALTLSNTLGIAVINLVGCLLTLLLAVLEATCVALRLRFKRLRGRLMQRDWRKRKNMNSSPAAQAVGAVADQHQMEESMESNV